MKKRILSLILSAVISVSFIPLNVSASENKTPSGIAFEDIGSEIEKFAEGKNYASFQTSVFCGDDVLYTGSFGYLDIENKIPADENSVYDWGSITKTLVWVSVMQLYEQGKIELEKDVREYLPDGSIRKLRYDEPITMLDLMNHTGGWQETSYSIAETDRSKLLSLEDSLHYCEPEQVFPPGEVTSYSNWGAALAGYIVQCISGEDFAEYVHKHIFGPLGMEHTSIAADHSDNEQLLSQRMKTRSYTITESGNDTINIKNKSVIGYFSIYPAGSVMGTIEDITKYGQALVSDKCPLFEKQETAEFLFSGSSFFGDTDIEKICHGFFPMYYGVKVLGHNGSTYSCSANLVFDRESKVGCAVFVNEYGETVFSNGIPKLIFGSPKDNPMFSDERFSEETSEKTDISGTYINSRGRLKGSLKFWSCMQLSDIEKGEDGGYYLSDDVIIKQFGDRIMLVENEEECAILDIHEGRNGEKIIDMGSISLIETKTAKPFKYLGFAYLAAAVIGAVFLITVWIMKIIRKNRTCKGLGVICISQAAKFISCLTFWVVFIIARAEKSGIHHSCAVTAEVIEILCILIYIVSAVFSVKNMVSKGENKAKPALYIYDVAANIFAVTSAVILELYKL